LFGGNAYRAKYGKQPHHALIESDFGADKIWKVDSKLGDARKPEAEAIGKALAPLGIVTGSFTEADGSDIGPMLADGLPGVGLSQDGTRYFDLHHTPDDTLDKIDPAQLRQNVAAWTAVLGVLSGGIEEPKRASGVDPFGNSCREEHMRALMMLALLALAACQVNKDEPNDSHFRDL
jgi:hypothetical protein